MEVNFECKRRGRPFNCDVGKIAFPPDSYRPVFEKKIVCPRCGHRTMDEVFLTELGQTQLTQEWMRFG